MIVQWCLQYGAVRTSVQKQTSAHVFRVEKLSTFLYVIKGKVIPITGLCGLEGG